MEGYGCQGMFHWRVVEIEVVGGMSESWPRTGCWLRVEGGGRRTMVMEGAAGGGGPEGTAMTAVSDTGGVGWPSKDKHGRDMRSGGRGVRQCSTGGW